MKEIRPQPGFQENAVDCPADIAIIGGSAGCGKTFCLLYEPLKYVFDPTPGFNGILFRRELVQIRATGGLWEKSCDLYRQLPKSLRPQQFGGNTHFRFKFPGGFDFQLAHLHDENTVYDYQGTEISYIAFDELTHFSEEQFFYMLSRNRSLYDVEPYVRASTNPQGEGWIKRMVSWWLYPDDYPFELLRGAPIPERQGIILYMARVDGVLIMDRTPQGVLNAMSIEMSASFPVDAIRSITFVAGKLFENEILMSKNPGYLGNLLGLSESERAQLLDGRWILLDNDAMRLYSNSAIADIFTNFVTRGRRYITADIALEGTDKFVIAIWEGWVLVEMRVFPKSMGDRVLEEIRLAAQQWGVPNRNIAFDSDGVGGFLKGFLRTAISFVGNASPMEERVKVKINGRKESPPQYYNLRSQCFFYLREIIENADILVIPEEHRTDIEQELRAIKKMTTSNNKLRVIPKDQIKKLIGRSPDFADVIMMRVVFELAPVIKTKKRTIQSF